MQVQLKQLKLVIGICKLGLRAKHMLACNLHGAFVWHVHQFCHVMVVM